MKKFASLFLALVLMFALCVSAGAKEITGGEDSVPSVPDGSTEWQDTQNVTVNVTGGAGEVKVYSVEIEWTNQSFTYHIDNADVWNPESHKYESDGLTAGWENGVDPVATIVVKNHSNEAVKVDAKFANDGYTSAEQGGFTLKLFDGTDADITEAKTIGEADVDPYLNDSTEAPSFTYKVKPTTVPTDPGTYNFGITVKITTPTP